MHHPYSVVTFSHLRWDFVFQRPQHLMSRLAAESPVHFVEEPLPDPGGPPRWEIRETAPNVTVWRPRTPSAAPGFHPEQLAWLEPMMGELAEAIAWAPVVTWLYTPLALPLARALAPQAAVYDCMDELSLFHGAPPELVIRERELLGWADLVFTGGPSLYRAKRALHPRVHCFTSSVDAAHFRRALRPSDSAAEPGDQAPLPRPRLGFFGVLDERLDAALVDALARARPEWQIVLVGPVVKIDPAALPRRPNIHYLGQRRYELLPDYLAGWDVCLLPFARNDATRFISPTKTLEYMAAERPIVSTPITDVVEPYGDVVYLGDTPEAFILACGHALESGAAERARRAARMRAVLARTSWDATAAAMRDLIAGVLRERVARPA